MSVFYDRIDINGEHCEIMQTVLDDGSIRFDLQGTNVYALIGNCKCKVFNGGKKTFERSENYTTIGMLYDAMQRSKHGVVIDKPKVKLKPKYRLYRKDSEEDYKRYIVIPYAKKRDAEIEPIYSFSALDAYNYQSKRVAYAAKDWLCRKYRVGIRVEMFQ